MALLGQMLPTIIIILRSNCNSMINDGWHSCSLPILQCIITVCVITNPCFLLKLYPLSSYQMSNIKIWEHMNRTRHLCDRRLLPPYLCITISSQTSYYTFYTHTIPLFALPPTIFSPPLYKYTISTHAYNIPQNIA